MTAEDAAAPHPSADEARVSTLELFFDLVFVFGFTQIAVARGLRRGEPLRRA